MVLERKGKEIVGEKGAFVFAKFQRHLAA